MSKIAIVGSGSVGATIAYAVMMRGLVRHLLLVDKRPDKAKAEAMDLNHGAMFVPPVEITHGDIDECSGARVVVVTAGAKQQSGQSRLDLAAANAEMYRSLIPAIVRTAPDALLLIVSNPVDVLTEVALRLSGFPAERVIGSGTVLDTSRFRFLIGRHFGLSVTNVHAYIIGEHGDSEVPVWSSAQVGNVPLAHLELPRRPKLDARNKKEIVQGVRDAAAQVIRAKGATNWAIGLAVTQVLQAILRDERLVLTVTRHLERVYGVSGVCLSIPWLVTGRGAETPFTIPCDVEEVAAFRRSAEVIQGVLKQIGS